MCIRGETREKARRSEASPFPAFLSKHNNYWRYLATAFNNIDIVVTNADEKQMKMKMVVTIYYGKRLGEAKPRLFPRF
jgi:hypothetical protein